MLQNGFPSNVSADDLCSRSQALARPSPVPNSPGLYAWYFRTIPPGIDTTGCEAVAGLTLLYVGISPKEPPTNGRAPSRSNLRQRLRTHFGGNAAGSTLRLTLGCLLTDVTGYPLRRVGSGGRLTLTNPGEQALDRWLADNALVAWHVAEKPWEAERDLLASGPPLPLNIRDNPCEAHTRLVRQVRADAFAQARCLPIIADSGGPRRARSSI
jgi:hypothetical protein